MKFKRIMPYLIAVMPFGAPTGHATAQAISAHKSYESIALNFQKSDLLAAAQMFDAHLYTTYNVTEYLESKARDFCNQYIDRMLGAQARLAPYVNKRGYSVAVRRELPGAPVGFHCVYGQCTQLARARDDMGDTLTIVPQSASRICTEFKNQMRKKYSSERGYKNCIIEGRMFESDSAYNAAKQQYLARNHATAGQSMARYAQRFESKNFSISAIAPGAMIVVPRTRGNTQQFHLITYIGYGRIENDTFIPDENGRPVYTAHNRERLGYLFDTWDTNNVFVANIGQIVRAQYAQELERVESMSHQQLVEYILAGNNSVNAELLNKLPISILQKMARDKYFKHQMPRAPKYDIYTIAQHNQMSPFYAVMRSNTRTI